MTDKLNALDKLIESVEAGTADHSDFAAIFPYPICDHARRAYDGSLVAAIALHQALLPGWVRWNVQESVFGHECDLMNGDEEASGISKVSIARAYLLAILRAYRSVQA